MQKLGVAIANERRSDRAALAQALLQSLRQKSYLVSEHPLAKFAGILSNAEATELQQIITANYRLILKK
ncbi:hypothetical protein [Fischerella thermalis]|uniref:Uncharacterized protein n=1 Tax=Fischerella thermalis CCMEE 5318 TaxID=2019666 RepID=A0A2N6LKR2_9CYAN|nr:hypothetical protein [Fischerella thermalis]PMB25418.1 hypothetical protein CEN46_05775 [Fischerella thermalis CCMEE 5318]